MKYVREATKDDVDQILKTMPEEDQKDLISGWAEDREMTVRDLLIGAYEKSQEVLSIIADDEVVGLFGIDRVGAVWFVRGQNIDKVSIRFVRHGHEYVDKWVKKYGKIYGHINKQYRKFINWLRWEGFDFVDCMNGYWRITKWGD